MNDYQAKGYPMPEGINLLGPSPLQAGSQCRVTEPPRPVLEEIAVLKERTNMLDSALTKTYSDFDLRLQRIEQTLGISR